MGGRGRWHPGSLPLWLGPACTQCPWKWTAFADRAHLLFNLGECLVPGLDRCLWDRRSLRPLLPQPLTCLQEPPVPPNGSPGNSPPPGTWAPHRTVFFRRPDAPGFFTLVWHLRFSKQSSLENFQVVLSRGQHRGHLQDGSPLADQLGQTQRQRTRPRRSAWDGLRCPCTGRARAVPPTLSSSLIWCQQVRTVQ